MGEDDFFELLRYPNIIYSDEEIDLKKTGGVYLTTIENVGKYSALTCARKICESNPDIKFNRIQYSKAKKEIYFVTNDYFKDEAWTERKLNGYKEYIGKMDTRDYLNYLINENYEPDEDLVSIWNLYYIIRNKEYNLRYRLNLDKTHLQSIGSLRCEADGIDYQNGVISVPFSADNESWIIYKFKRIDDDLILIECDEEDTNRKKIFPVYGYKLLTLCEGYEKINEFWKNTNINISSESTIFNLTIDSEGITLTLPKGVFETGFKFKKEFEFEKSEYDCISYKTVETFENNWPHLLENKIYVRIDDCPEWTKEILYQSVLKRDEEKKQNEEQQRKIEYSPAKKISIAEDEIVNNNIRAKQKTIGSIFNRKKH